jgi:heme b synthase
LSGHPASTSGPGGLPQLIAWEVTRCCILSCKHCRAAARPTPYANEFTTAECFRLLDNIASFAKPIIILTGGEPMLRPDIYEIAAYATRIGLPVVMAPCGVLLDEQAAGKIVQSGIRAISISLDGATAASHDAFRGVSGAFDSALRGIEAAKKAGLSFQINTTVTQHNLAELPQILELSLRLGAKTFNPFLLVPTGRGKELADQEITPQQYEETLLWLARQQDRTDIQIRVTCAPHYQRILRQRQGAAHPSRPSKGCMGGQSFAFISHTGKVQICGFLDIECGDVRAENFDFRKIWETSEVFLRLRDPHSYGGRCGACEFHRVCGGCRARAYAMTGDYLAEEPFCTYQPKRDAARREEPGPAGEELDETDKRLLSIIQSEFPVTERPYAFLASRLAGKEDDILARTNRLRDSGVIRRLGAVFDSRRVGLASTLVAAHVPGERLDEVAAAVSALPGVTHNYRREHAYNLWFTLSAADERALDATLEQLRRETGIDEIHAMPAEAVYKIRVNFPTGNQTPKPANAPASAEVHPRSALPPLSLGDEQRAAAHLLEGDLPRSAQPYAELAGELGWTEQRVIGQVREWLTGGAIRRIGAIVRHHRLGYVANGMAVFDSPPERVDELGGKLAELPEVSHCYRRRSFAGFPFNLFGMFHGRSREQVRQVVADFAGRNGIARFDVLFSTQEYKKASPQYFLR